MVNPTGPSEGTAQIIRGGAYSNSYYVSYSGIQGGNKSSTRVHVRYGIPVALSAESVKLLIAAKAEE
ncbi:MAG: hypothetical protein ACKVH8_11460 [Pirellulales bacterium]